MEKGQPNIKDWKVITSCLLKTSTGSKEGREKDENDKGKHHAKCTRIHLWSNRWMEEPETLAARIDNMGWIW